MALKCGHAIGTEHSQRVSTPKSILVVPILVLLYFSRLCVHLIV